MRRKYADDISDEFKELLIEVLKAVKDDIKWEYVLFYFSPGGKLNGTSVADFKGTVELERLYEYVPELKQYFLNRDGFSIKLDSNDFDLFKDKVYSFFSEGSAYFDVNYLHTYIRFYRGDKEIEIDVYYSMDGEYVVYL